MARADIVERTKDILYGQGLGQRPPIRECAADAAESVSGSKVTFSVASGEGDKIKAGQVLSLYGSTDDTDSYALYVLSVSSDSITAVNGYNGSPVVADTNLDGALLEQNPWQLEYFIHKRIDAVISRLLWDDVYTLTAASVTPDLTDGQVEVPATVERIVSAQQQIGGEWVNIPFGIVKNVSTSVSSTGNLGVFDAVDGSTVYYTYMAKVDATTTDEALIELIALGAAALLSGASVTERTVPLDGVSQSPRSVGQELWRDFVTLRRSIAEDLAADTAIAFEVERG